MRREERGDVRVRGVECLYQARELWSHDKDVPRLALSRVPVGVGRSAGSHNSAACSRDDLVLSEPEAEFAVEDVPRLIVRMVHVERGNPMPTDLGSPLDHHEIVAGYTIRADCKSPHPRHHESIVNTGTAFH